MKPTTLSLFSLALAATVSASAQAPAKPATTAHSTAAHKTAATTVTTTTRTPNCVTLPPISDKVPALPADAKCVKPLYTLTRKSDIVLDYVSPMVGTAVRDALSPPPMTISLLYVDTKVGTGELAQPGKWYTVNYTGYLPDGSKFDSSEGREPLSFPYGQHRVIAGWDTGFEGMHVGGKRRLYIPFQLAYGEQGHPPTIPAKSELIFDMELLSMSDTQPVPKPAPAPAPKPEASAPASPAGAGAPPPTSSTTPAATPAPATATPAAKPEAK